MAFNLKTRTLPGFRLFGWYFKIYENGFWFRNKKGNGYAFKFFRSYDNLIFSYRNKLRPNTKYFKYCLIEKLNEQA